MINSNKDKNFFYDIVSRNFTLALKNVHLNKESAASSLGAAAKFDLSSVLDGICFPFLVMTGDHDPNLSSSRDIADSSPVGELRILKNVGHGSILQRPDLTLNNFLDWHTQNKNKYA